MKGLSVKEIKKKLTPEEFMEFNKWLVGQTVPVLGNGKEGVYEYDFKCWLEWKRNKGPEPIWD